MIRFSRTVLLALLFVVGAVAHAATVVPLNDTGQTNAAHVADEVWKDHVAFDKGKLSVEVSDVLLGELLKEIGLKTKAKISAGAALAKQHITVNFSELTLEEGMGRIVAAQFDTNSSGSLLVTEKDGLFSVQADGATLGKVMKKLSDISGSEIRFLSPNDQNVVVKATVKDQPIQDAIGEIIKSLPAGGYASAEGAKGKQKSFFITSRKGADAFVKEAQTLLEKIKNGKKPKPAEVKAWLLQVAAFGFPVDGPGTSLFIVPVLMLIDQNYPMYKDVSLSLLQDGDGMPPLRAAMLELAGRHWEDADSRKTLQEVFQRPADNPVLQGMVSLTLARHGENIGDLVVQRYPDASPDAKFFYAQTISALGRKDAIPMLLDDTQQTQNTALRDAATSSLIKLDPTSTQTTNVVSTVIHSAQPVPTMERTASDMEREALAMHTVMAVAEAEANGFQAMDRMLAIARDESVAVDVRLTSLEALAPKVSAMSPSEKNTLGEQLVTLGEQVSKSSQLAEMNQQRMAARITLLQKMLAEKKGQ